MPATRHTKTRCRLQVILYVPLTHRGRISISKDRLFGERKTKFCTKAFATWRTLCMVIITSLKRRHPVFGMSFRRSHHAQRVGQGANQRADELFLTCRGAVLPVLLGRCSTPANRSACVGLEIDRRWLLYAHRCLDPPTSITMHGQCIN